MRRSMQIEVDVPVEKAFEYLADFEKRPEWTTGIIRVAKTSEGPIGVGTTFSVKGTGMNGTVTITEFAKNRRISFEGRVLGMRALNFMETAPLNGDTRITLGYQTRRGPLLLLPLWLCVEWVMLFFSPFMRPGESRMMRGLKERLESQK